MTEAATESRPNKVEVSDAGPSMKKLRIEIPAESVSAKLGESLELLQVEAVLPGFRKGRVPPQLIQRRFGEDLKKEARQQLVSEAARVAFEDLELQVVGTPTLPEFDKVEIEIGKPLIFEVEAEVMPTFDLPPLDGVNIRKPLLEVTEEMINSQLSRLAINEGELEEREVPEAGDYLTGHGVMRGADGTEFHNIEGAVVRVPEAGSDGSGMILGVLVPDFAKQLGLPKAGETAAIKVKGPESHENEAIRGADLTITFNVATVNRIIPATIDEVVSRLGFESEEQLRGVVRDQMEARIQHEQRDAMRQQLASHLLKHTKFQLPTRLTADQARRNFERHRMELMHRGVDPAKIEENLARLRSSSIEMAWMELKLFFILSRFADERKIQVDEAEANSAIAAMAAQRGMRPDKLRHQLIQSNQINTLIQKLLEHKVLDSLLASAVIEEMSSDDYIAHMKAEAEAEKNAYYTDSTPSE